VSLPAHFVGPQYRLADEIPPRACRDILPLLAEARGGISSARRYWGPTKWAGRLTR